MQDILNTIIGFMIDNIVTIIISGVGALIITIITIKYKVRNSRGLLEIAFANYTNKIGIYLINKVNTYITIKKCIIKNISNERNYDKIVDAVTHEEWDTFRKVNNGLKIMPNEKIKLLQLTGNISKKIHDEINRDLSKLIIIIKTK